MVFWFLLYFAIGLVLAIITILINPKADYPELPGFEQKATSFSEIPRTIYLWALFWIITVWPIITVMSVKKVIIKVNANKKGL